MLPNEMQPPKTRFNSRDKFKGTHSTFLPRLKSFPTEKIKKLDNQPIFFPRTNSALIEPNSQETETCFANSSNNGHGNAIPVTLSSYQQSKDKSDTDQQQIVANHQQICQINPHSENLFTQSIASSEKHPFVSNMLQQTVCDQSLQNPSAVINQPIIIQSPLTQVAMSQSQQSLNSSHAIIDPNCNKTYVHERERKPIGGVNHKQMFIQPKQATVIQDANAPLIDRYTNNCQNIYHDQLHNPFQQISQQMNKQTQHNVHHQQMLPQAFNKIPPPIFDQRQYLHNNSDTFYNYYNQQLSSMQVSGHGMTSPQDMTVNQMRLIQHNLPVQNKNLGYPVNLQPTWPQNNQWIQTTNLHQSPQQWQYYFQNTNFNQKDSRNQDQSNLLQNHKSSNQQSNAEIHNQQNDEKKKLQFTPDMIRDQELLVFTMRQQGIPEEIMRRQFDALLNEQQKHLIYLMQFQQQKDPNIKKILAQKRIEKEEKPEWMIHITPPRISYNEIERIKAQQKDQKKQYLTDNQLPEKINKTMTIQQQDYCQEKKQEIKDQPIFPQQMYVQINPHQLLQQQIINWPYKNNHQDLYSYATCYPYNHQQTSNNNTYHQANSTSNKYIPYNMRYNPYYSHSEQQKIEQDKEHNPNLSNSINNQRLLMNLACFEQNERPIEPSSLLKMRIYKELIRPQKRYNGLQDIDTIQKKVLETLQNPSNRKDLEYLANITKIKPPIRLNGIQDSNEIPEDMQPRSLIETSSQSQKKISANGLENTRNPNNPIPCILRPKRADEPPMMEYPQQRQNARTCYNMQAKKENDSINDNQQQCQLQNHAVSCMQNARSDSYDQNIPISQGRHDENTIFQYANISPQHYSQMQQYYLNEQNFGSHNGGQGDVVSMQRPDAPSAMKIDCAGGDIGEKSNTERATKHVDMQAIQRTNFYGQPEIHETKTIGGIKYLVRKPEYTSNNCII